MYREDSFFTLTSMGQAGLLILSLLLAGLMLWLARSLPGPRPVRLLLAFLAFGVFIWLSPQIYYQYYRVIIDGLPQQIVVKPPDPGEVLRLLGFFENANLAAHGRGILGWLMLLMAWRR